MSEAMATRCDDGHAATLGAADWLCLAAAPTFAIMAVLTAISGSGAADILCAAAQDASPLNGMAPMYALMSAFHSAPWLKLIGASSRARSHEPAVGQGPRAGLSHRRARWPV